MCASVVPELCDVPDYEGVLGDALLHCLQDGILRLLEPDVVVGNEVASRHYRLSGRWAVSSPGFNEVREQGFDSRPGVAMQRDSVGLDSCEFGIVYVDVNQRGRLAGGVAQRKARSYTYHHVGGLHHVVKLVHLLSLAPGAEAGAVGQRMTVRDGALASTGRNDGYVCCLGQFDQGFLRV